MIPYQKNDEDLFWTSKIAEEPKSTSIIILKIPNARKYNVAKLNEDETIIIKYMINDSILCILNLLDTLILTKLSLVIGLSTLQHSKKSTVVFYFHKIEKNRFQRNLTGINEIKAAIEHLKNSKAPGPNNIQPKMLDVNVNFISSSAENNQNIPLLSKKEYNCMVELQGVVLEQMKEGISRFRTQ